MTHNKANKSKISALIFGLTMCLALMLGIVFASPTSTAYAADETQIETLGVAFRKVEVGDTLDAAFELENATNKTLKVPAGANYTVTLTSVHKVKDGQKIKLWEKDDASLPWSRVETQFVEQNVAYCIRVRFTKCADAACPGIAYAFDTGSQYAAHEFVGGCTEKRTTCGNLDNPDATHNLKFVAETPATCIAGGMKAHYTCEGCGQFFDEDKNETTEEALKTPVSPYYGHSFGFWVEEQYATCQAPGRKGYKHCSICDKYYDASNKEITDWVILVNPDGHELDDLVAEIPATCKDTGVKEHRVCRLCGKNCDPITRKEIADLTIPTTNDHTFGGWTDEVAPTTTEFGTKGHKDCTVCGRHFDKDGGEITELRIAKIGTHNVVINGESKFYEHGESVTVTAEDKEGKVFKGWQDASGKIVSTQKEYTFEVKDEMVLTAVYEDKSSGGGEITPPAKKDGLSGGAIAGIVTGSAAVAGLGGFAVLWFAVKKKTFADLGVAIKALFTKKK